METNVVSTSDMGYEIGTSWAQSTREVLAGATSAVIDDGYLDDISSTLGTLLVSLLVIGGLFWVVRRLVKAYRSTR